MENKFNSLDKMIIDILLRESKFDIENQSELLKFNPVSIFNSIERLKNNKLIKIDAGNRISRSSEFYSLVFKFRWSLFKREMPWKQKRID